jgi:quercetin dioxygenase-like cupin family protein
MNRRDFVALGCGFALTECAPPAQANPNPKSAAERHPVLVRAGLSRLPDGTEAPMASQQTVVRSIDSEGRLAAFVIPVGQHPPYVGAPLHLHHAQDEWLYVLAGEFVAEVGGKRQRMGAGDSLLMPMNIPHRWSHASSSTSGAIHLYTPAGLMDVWWDPSPNGSTPQTPGQRRAEFEKYGTTLLGIPLTKEEIDHTT